MFKAEHFRAKAAQSEEASKNTTVPNEILEFQRSKTSFDQLAGNEDWLADNYAKMIHSEDSGNALPESDEHVLRCLGAAVILQWNTIPTKLQRELFDTAGSLGDVLQTGTLRGQIARFLHTHKDEETHIDCNSQPHEERNADGS